MDDFKDIEKLLRLKRHEVPKKGYFDRFLREFHQRQRAELLKRSSLRLCLERGAAFFAELRSPKWGYAAGVAVLCLMIAFFRYFGDTGNSVSDKPNDSYLPHSKQKQAQPHRNPNSILPISHVYSLENIQPISGDEKEIVIREF